MAQNIVTVSQSDNEVTVSQTPRTTVTVTSAGIQGPQGPQGEGTAEVEALNIFSGSIQIEVDNLTAATGSYLTEVPSGTISGSAQITAFGFISESVDITPLNNFSGSIQTEVDNLTSKTGSYATTGSNSFSGDQNVDGNLTITGNLTANQYIVSSSVTFITQSFSSGSTIFGDTSDDTHQFTGSVNITESLSVNGPTVTTTLSSSYIDLDVLANGDIPAHKAGRIFFGAEDGALEVYNEEADITLQVGQEIWVRVFNPTVDTILNGTPVRISGSQGDRLNIYPATSTDTSDDPLYGNHILGLATHDIEASTEGYITEFGIVRGVDTSGFAAGDILYLQTGSPATPAEYFRNDPPPFPYDVIQVGFVAKSASPNGFIDVKTSEPVHLHDISELSGSAVVNNGELWVYESSSGAWKNSNVLPNIIASGSFSGSFEGDGSNLTGIVTDLTPLNTFTGSIQTEVDNLTAATSSYLTEVTSGTISGSAQITAFGFISESVDTSAFATTGSNNFVGDQVITGSLTISGSSTFTILTASIVAVDAVKNQDTGQYFSKRYTNNLLVFGGYKGFDDITGFGSDNVVVGGPTSNSIGNSIGTYNTFVGGGAGSSFNNPQNCTAIGGGALFAGTSFTYTDVTAVGARAGLYSRSAYAVMIGSEAFRNSSWFGYTDSGDYSVFIGYRSGYDAPVLGSSFQDRNVAIGAESMYRSHLSSSIAIGYQSNYSAADEENRKGSLVTLLGPYTNVSQSVNLINATGIGANVEVQQSNTVILGNNADVGIGTTTPTAKLEVSGSVVISDILTLEPTHPAPTSAPSGSIISSGSGAELKPYFWNGSTWTSMI